MSDGAQHLMVLGIAELHAGELEAAKRDLERCLDQDPDTKQIGEIWYWLSEAQDTHAEQRRCLEESLAIDPFNLLARRSLSILDGKLDPAGIVDADRLPAHAPHSAFQSPSNGSPERFICPKCGGRMTYTPDGQNLTCEYCDTHQKIQAKTEAGSAAPAHAQEQDFLVAMATRKGHIHPETIHTLACQSCGASFLLMPETLSLTCPYCGSVYVAEKTEAVELIMPSGQIPLKIQCEDARERILHMPEIQSGAHLPPGAPYSIYLPAWCFTIAGEIPWKCLRYENREWVPDSGIQIAQLEDQLVAASPKLSKIFPGVITGFDLGGVVSYDSRYLVNVPAETYQVSVGDASLAAREAALGDLRGQIVRSFFSRTRDLTLNSMNLLVESFKLVLLPFWTANLVTAAQPELVYINGQNGEAWSARTHPKGKSFLAQLFG